MQPKKTPAKETRDCVLYSLGQKTMVMGKAWPGSSSPSMPFVDPSVMKGTPDGCRNLRMPSSMAWLTLRRSRPHFSLAPLLFTSTVDWKDESEFCHSTEKETKASIKIANWGQFITGAKHLYSIPKRSHIRKEGFSPINCYVILWHLLWCESFHHWSKCTAYTYNIVNRERLIPTLCSSTEFQHASHRITCFVVSGFASIMQCEIASV